MSRVKPYTTLSADFNPGGWWKIGAALCALAMSSGWATRAYAASCVNDIDCTEGGTGCGTMVCSYTAAETCAPAGQQPVGMDGWCTTTSDCKCQALGATCEGTYCTFTTPPADEGGASSSSGSSTGSSSGSSSGVASADEDASVSGSAPRSSSGCNAAPSPTSLFAPACVAAVAGGLVAARRRRRRAS